MTMSCWKDHSLVRVQFLRAHRGAGENPDADVGRWRTSRACDWKTIEGAEAMADPADRRALH